MHLLPDGTEVRFGMTPWAARASSSTLAPVSLRRKTKRYRNDLADRRYTTIKFLTNEFVGGYFSEPPVHDLIIFDI